jgi:hypothetical protein
MRQLLKVIVLGAVLGAPWALVTLPTSAASLTAPSCTPTTIRITDYNTVVGTGSVNDLFWVHNVSSQACALRGYMRVSYVGTYGLTTKGKKRQLLAVQQTDSFGANGNDLGGIKRGVAMPTVTLKPKGDASFWIYGTDESHQLPNGQQSRCTISYKMMAWLPGATSSIQVSPLRANGFFWCGGIYVHPIVPGVSGSLPPRSLKYFFGTPS